MTPAADHETGEPSEVAYALAIGRACNEAVSTLGDLYVIDDVARRKLMGRVLKIARRRLRSGQPISASGDVGTIAMHAVRDLLHLQSGCP